jgi:hypothetical protein
VLYPVQSTKRGFMLKSADLKFPKGKAAHFWCPEYPNYSVWLKPKVEKFLGPGIGLQVDEKSGFQVKFEERQYNTDDKKVIQALVDLDDFDLVFFPNPRDPSGFWRENGYFQEENKKILKRVNPEVDLKDKGIQEQVAGQAKVVAQRTSNTAPIPKE